MGLTPSSKLDPIAGSPLIKGAIDNVLDNIADIITVADNIDAVQSAATAVTDIDASLAALELIETNVTALEVATNADALTTSADVVSTTTSKTDAETAESGAGVSEANALASASIASNAASNAGISATLAADWAEKGDLDVVGAGTRSSKHHALLAEASKSSAESAESGANTSASNAATSESNASTSETNASTSEANAATSESNALGSASTASGDAASALVSKDAALVSELASAASALEATNAAASVESGLVMMGQFDASSGIAPASPSGIPNESSQLYRISVLGTIATIEYKVGDCIVWDTETESWFKIDNSASAATLSNSEIKIAYEANANTNVFLDAEQSKLAGIESGAKGDQTGAEIKVAYELEANTNPFTDTEQTKLNGIASGATVDQSGSAIKVAYELEGNTNAFTDAFSNKLSGIESSATIDQTGSEIRILYEGETDRNAFTDTEKSKLGAIETNATADQTAAEIIAAVLTLDGPGSGLNADLLDSKSSEDFVQVAATGLGVTGLSSLDSVTDTSAEWAAIPVGYSKMIAASIGTAGGSPIDNYGYFTKVANRDAGGGWAGLWVGYASGENYVGQSNTSGTFATWNKLWSDANDGAGSGLDADLLDGNEATYFAPQSTTYTKVEVDAQTSTSSSNWASINKFL